MDRLAGQAQVRDGGEGVPARNTHLGLVGAQLGDLAPLLRGVVLIGEPSLGLRFDLEGVGLGSVRGRYQLIVRALRLRKARRGLGGVVDGG
ncbi:hypothetical protein [Methylobacterium sp. 1973]|uniref:hypothetical protein n=1 Tax=Methylobacterium sp. 1973 TaxID=3156421 RepID=UPI00339ABA41